MQSYEKPLSLYWGNSIFGGSVLEPTRIQYNSEVIANPLKSSIAYTKQVSQLQEMIHPTMGYFVIKNVLVKKYSNFHHFVDIFVLVTDIKTEKDYNKL